MADLFETLDCLFNKRVPPETLHPVVLHRFLASNRDLAPFARDIGMAMQDPEMVWALWRTALPKAPGAPRFKYAGPAKNPAAEDLAAAIVRVEKLSVVRAAEVVEMLLLRPTELVQACAHYGVETVPGGYGADPADTGAPAPRRGRKKK